MALVQSGPKLKICDYLDLALTLFYFGAVKRNFEAPNCDYSKTAKTVVTHELLT